MKRKIVLTVEMELADMSLEERREAARDYGCAASDLQGVRDAEPQDIAECVQFALEHPDNEMWAGSELYVEAKSIKVTGAKWL